MRGMDTPKKQQLFEVFDEEKKEIASIKKRVNLLCRRHGLEDAEVLYLIRRDAGYKHVPVEIFSQKLSPLESVVSFMKNNLNLRLSEIGAILNRDERTIWITYHNSLKKQKMLSVPANSSVLIPVMVLNSRNFSILEAVALYLRQKKGMKLTQIAKMLKKSTSAVWTSLHRAEFKSRQLTQKRGRKAR